MIHLGTPDDLKAPALKRYCCIIAYTTETGIGIISGLSFDHCFCMAANADDAYNSCEMEALERKLIDQGHTLENNYVVEVTP